MQKIGIWGFGVVGKSVIAHYRHTDTSQKKALAVFNNKTLTASDRDFLTLRNIQIYEPDSLAKFLDEQDTIIPSPGIDLRPYQQFTHKFVAELDLFQTYWHKPIIAITGTIGKTSITHILSELLATQGIRVATGGNIGTGMLDLLGSQECTDYAILEVSSFQLEHCTQFAPTLAIITNVYPNHLDRHGTFELYAQAKSQILVRAQQALVPTEIIPLLQKLGIQKPLHQFSQEPESTDITLYTFTKLNIKNIPQTSYPINWLILAAALDLLNITLPVLDTIEIPDHRLEHIGTARNIAFYNDSKSTIPEATLAAVHKLQPAPIVLFIGGISKGVDRTHFCAKLSDQVKEVICFGAEAHELYHACRLHNIIATTHATLEEAFAYCMQQATAGDIVLFSPAGASFDLFPNYQARGARFKELVQIWLIDK